MTQEQIDSLLPNKTTNHPNGSKAEITDIRFVGNMVSGVRRDFELTWESGYSVVWWDLKDLEFVSNS